MKIDLVIPYVDNTDKVWQKNYLDYFQKHNVKYIASMHGHRFEDIGLIHYQLKLVAKNMPWINTIYLLLSNKEQCPKDLPTNCKVVYHQDFIPYKYLPTFNSCTIEMFLWNIKGLEEHFIYANDDMLPIRLLKESDFFYRNHIRMNFYEDELDKISGEFRHQCYNSYKLVEKNDDFKYFYPEHTFTPMIKSHCLECFNMGKDTILPKIRAYRTEEQHNQYIYPLYERKNYGAYNSNIKFFYSQLGESKEDLLKELDESTIFCANLVLNKENGKVLKNYLDKICE